MEGREKGGGVEEREGRRGEGGEERSEWRGEGEGRGEIGSECGGKERSGRSGVRGE